MGNQRLYGKKITLNKPIAILQSDIGDADASDNSIRIVQIIKEKYLFDTRPITIINKTKF